MMFRGVRRMLPLIAALMVMGCDDDAGKTTVADTSAGTDTAVDGAEDSASDTGGEDTAEDTGGEDSASDTTEDTSPPEDTAGDTSPPEDTTADVPEDTATPGLEGELCSDDAGCVTGLVCASGACASTDGACAADEDCDGDTYCCSGDCLTDPGASAVCIPYGSGDRGDVNDACTGSITVGQMDADVQCEWSEPPPGDLFPNHRNVLTTPLVADLPNDSGAGAEIVIVTYNHTDGGSASSAGTDPNYYGVIRILNGQTCEVLESIDDPSNRVIGSSPPAIADLDGDGDLEIVTQRAVTGLVAYTWDETLGRYKTWWSVPDNGSASNISSANRYDGPAIHDLDDDGKPEIISGGEVYDGVTGLRLNPSQIPAGAGAMSISVLGDVDANGSVELVSGDVYTWNTGTSSWDNAYPGVTLGRHYAYADFGTPGASASEFDYGTLDGVAEIVSTGGDCSSSYCRVQLATLDGQVLMNTGRVVFGGGPPTLGDFDNDGFPEIATAGGANYWVFDPVCDGCAQPFVRWSQPSQDRSSRTTGSSIFDFEGDGKAEAVYADECFTRIYEGETGEVLYSAWRTSCTWYENPIVADSDKDQNTEIIVGSNNNCNIGCPTIDPIHRGLRCTDNAECLSSSCVEGFCRCTEDAQCESDYRCQAPIAGTPGTGNTCRAYHPPGAGKTGVRVLRDRLDRWASSRPLWNQHAYSVTNINDDGTIPKTADWTQNFLDEALNNYRQNVQGPTGSTDFPDITGKLSSEEVCQIRDGQVVLTATVCNRGNRSVGAAMPATFYRGEPGAGDILCVSYTSGPVPVGGCLEVSCEIDAEVAGTVTMVVNDDGEGRATTVECNGENNTDRAEIAVCIPN